jgi:hypothetical protein
VFQLSHNNLVLRNNISLFLEPKDVRSICIICRKYPREKPEKLERIDVKGLSIIKHMAQSEKARAVEYVSTALF